MAKTKRKTIAGASMCVFVVLSVVLIVNRRASNSEGLDSGSRASNEQQQAERKLDPQESVDISFGLTFMSELDKASAMAQRDCPYTDDQLGAMERPYKLMYQGAPV